LVGIVSRLVVGALEVLPSPLLVDSPDRSALVFVDGLQPGIA